jgi:hypothetical protein
MPPAGLEVAMSAIYRADSPPGPAGRWLIDHLKQQDALRLQPQEASAPKRTATFTPVAQAMNA